MQTTLLGLAIAFIIALIAALVGPHFIDWNQFRPQFEAEASRALGAPVKVDGLLDARLLPTPTLHLQSVTVGGAADPRKIKTDRLDVEFSLSAAMRGEWRATELTLEGFAADLGLDKQGRVEGLPSGGRLNLGALTIDRLNFAGKLGLYDAASGTSRQLDDFKFNGDVRALAGTMRGEGSFNIEGVRTPFRISSGQSSDGKGTRLRFSIDPGDRALFADLDGILAFDALAPKFEGALTLARPEDAKPAEESKKGAIPWRLISRIKLDPSSARLDQVETAFGPEDSALRFSGSGDIRFGASPLVHLALLARQLDADRLLNKSAAGESANLVARLRDAVGQFPAAPIPMQLELSADQVALVGRPVKNIAIEIRADKGAWTISKFEMRAPGGTSISATGAVSSAAAPDAAFNGPVSIESTDPDSFFAWLQGRSDVSLRAGKPLRLRGNATIAADRFAVDDLKADLDGGVMTGRVAFTDLPEGKTRLEAALGAENFNLDAAGGLVSSFAGPKFNLPDETKISLDIGKALFAGEKIRPVVVEFTASANAISLDRLSIGDSKSFAVTGSGSFDRAAGNGKLSLTANAASLERIGAVIAPLLPALADRLKAVEPTPGDVRLQLSAALETAKDQPRANGSAAIDIDAPQVKGSMTIRATPQLDAARGVDLAALPRTDAGVEIKLASDKSSAMLSLLGLDRILSAQDGAAQFETTLAGPFNSPYRVNAKLAGAGFDGDVKGTIDPWPDTSKADLNLAIRKVDPSIVFDLNPATVSLQSLLARLSVSGKTFTFDDLDAAVGGSRTRGRVIVTRGDDIGIDGNVSIDTLDLASAVGVALGTAGRSGTEPSGRGLLRGWRGSLAFQAAKVTLPGGSELQSFGGKLNADGSSLALEGKGTLGGGEVKATADARQFADGMSASVSVNATDVDGPALHYRGLTMPDAKASYQALLTSQGRSATALSGGLSGAGVVTLKNIRVAGLNPQAFEAAVRAADSGQAIDDSNLKTVIEPVLASGALAAPSAQIAFTVKDGRFRVEPTALEASRTRATVSGGYDIAADQMDARVILSAAVLKPATRRPEIRIDLNGSPDGPVRSVDVASLLSWLTMRSIDRQTQQLDRFESGGSSKPEPQPMSLDEELPQAEPIPRAEVRLPKRDPRRASGAKTAATGVATPSPPTSVQPLPPATTIKPAPAPATPPRPRGPVVLTPPASGTSSF